jgi:hypothetical protein
MYGNRAHPIRVLVFSFYNADRREYESKNVKSKTGKRKHGNVKCYHFACSLSRIRLRVFAFRFSEFGNFVITFICYVKFKTGKMNILYIMFKISKISLFSESMQPCRCFHMRIKCQPSHITGGNRVVYKERSNLEHYV